MERQSQRETKATMVVQAPLLRVSGFPSPGAPPPGPSGNQLRATLLQLTPNQEEEEEEEEQEEEEEGGSKSSAA